MSCSSLILLLMWVGDPTTNWTGFRNDGTATVAGALPQHWSADEGITWQAELDGYGQSCPVIWQGQVYVTTVLGPQKEQAQVTSFDLKTGAVRWKRVLDTSQQAPSNYMQSRAAPTPCADEQGIYAFFESGDLVAYDHAGNLRWRRDLARDEGPFDNNHGLGTSPVQTRDLILLNLEHRGPSRLVAIDKQTGATLWKQDRPSSSSWSTPVIVEQDGIEQVLVSSGGSVTLYDVETGKQRHEITGLSGNSLPSPVAAPGRVLIGARGSERGRATSDGSAGGANSNLCLELSDGEGMQIAWRARRATCDYASPVIVGNYAYFLNQVGVLYCLDLTTGEDLYAERLGTTCWASPIVAGDLIYLFGKDGMTKIVQAGPEYRELQANPLWDPEQPPLPESYVEASGDSEARTTTDPTAVLQEADRDQDGTLSAQELEESGLKERWSSADLNADGQVDAAEQADYLAKLQARRTSSRQNARDPIVYGAAAVSGALVIRTGTRLYGMIDTRENQPQRAEESP